MSPRSSEIGKLTAADWKNLHGKQSYCVVIVSWPSKMTPKSFAADTMSTFEDDVVVDRGSWEMVRLTSWCHDPSHISWVLAFSFGPFCPIQYQVAPYIRPNWTAACWLSTTGALIYTCVLYCVSVAKYARLSATCLHLSSKQPIGIIITLEACLKLLLTSQALICVGATNAR